MDSELARKVDEYPVVHNTMEYLLSTYGVLKDANPLLKASLQRSEDTAYWLRQKTDDLMEATNLKEPLKRLDAAAAQSIVNVEQKTFELRNHVEMTNAQLNSRVKAISNELRKRSDDFRYQIFESIQTVLDYMEESLQPVLLPPTKEALKYCEDTTPMVTLRRVMDLTYRLNAGTVKYSINIVKDVTDPVAWKAFLNKNFHPANIQQRFLIIRQEILAPIGRAPNYINNKELTSLDRRVIAGTRLLIETTNQIAENTRSLTNQISGLLTQSFMYTTDLLKQIVEARSLRDVSGIGYHETHRLLEALADKIPALRDSFWMSSILDWLIEQEKIAAAE